MSLKINEISDVITNQIKDINLSYDIYEQGIVISVGDGIAYVYGMKNCKYGELVEFENKSKGIVLNIEPTVIGVIILGSMNDIKEKSIVKRTNEVAMVKASSKLLGRVINPLGQTIDEMSKDNLNADNKYVQRPIENSAPGIIDRKPITRPLLTGILAVDSMVPIGKGQRELIIGDKQTGKTTMAIDTIINQKDKNVICIYVAIGQKNSNVAMVTQTLKKYDALKYTTIVNASASDPAAMQYIAPYSGCAIAEYFMYQEHRDVLIIYDDLSKHAMSYRAISLLLKRPPGREAYPGDIFYIHSRLLERAGQLSDEFGGGSITAIPIIETQDEDISAYIPTNVISITDGQIHLDSQLFNAGQKPAINSGLSVSRVGGAAQNVVMKKISSSLRINLAQYFDLRIFAQFGSELDDITKKKIDDGKKLLEILKQDKEQLLDEDSQVIMLYAALNDYLSNVLVKDVIKYTENLVDYIKKSNEYISVNKFKEADRYIELLDSIIKKYIKDSDTKNV